MTANGAALEFDQARWAAVVESSAVAIVGWALNDTITNWNPGAERLYGYAADEVIGRSAALLLSSEVDDELTSLRASLLAGERIEGFETRRRTKDGRLIDVELHLAPLRGEDGAIVGASAVVLDLTARRAAEAALVASEVRFRALVQGGSEMIAIVEPDGTARYASPATERVLGYPVDVYLSQPTPELIHPEDQKVVAQYWNALLVAPGARQQCEYRARHADGRWVWLEAIATNLTHDPAVGGIVLNARDVSARKLLEADLRQREARHLALLDAIPDVMFRLDRNGAYLDVKAEQSASLVAPVSELLGRTVRDVLPAPVADQLLQAANRALNGDGMQTFEYRLDVMQGPREFESRIVANGADETISIVRDVTERKRAEQELRFRGELLDQATVAIMATDAKGIVSHWNRHSEQLYGWTRDEVIGRPIGEITVGPAEAETAAGILANLAAGVPWEGQFVCQRKDGTRVPVHIVDSPVRNEQGEVIGIVGVSYDVSERQNFERRLSHLAFHDALTGLPNRSRFLERLNEALNRAARNHGPVIILFLDLDRFKVLNDSFGHGAGDGVLLQVGRRLADSLRLGDLIARFGGDEFVVLPAAGANPEDAGLIAERLLTVLETPFEVDGRETFLGGSIGIAVTGPTITTAEQLLRAADIALYEAKGAGRGQWALYDDVVGERARRRLELESDLRHALVRGDFELHYQPLIDLASDVLYGFEALLRWRHPERGLVSPAEFLPVAEETGLIEPIGEWVLAEACRQAAQWQALRPERPLVMSVNVSPRQVHGPAFGHALWRVLSETGLAPHRLKLEVTEAALAIDDAITVAFLHAARALGVQVALDDFGTGYSSLGRLHTLPLDVLKIDRSFIARLGHDPQAEAIVRAVVMLGHELGLSVTAEGIETEEQRRRVFALGCDRGQGYLFARPLTAEAASAWLIEPVAGDALDAVR